jgi:DNA-directed RNA polymerase subunit K/omega
MRQSVENTPSRYVRKNVLQKSSTRSTETATTKKKSNKVTEPYMTQYEYARILGFRATQIKLGYPPKIEYEGPFDPIYITKLEIESRVAPVVIIRHIPDSSQPSGFRKEIWDLKDMHIRDC